MRDRVVGLDIGASSVKAAQVLRTGPNSYVVEKQAARLLSPGWVYDGRITEGHESDVCQAIRALFAEAGFATRDVVLGLNSSSGVFMSEVIAPLLPPSDIDAAMPMIVAANNPNLDLAENILSYTIVDELEGEHDERHLRVLVYNARIDYANKLALVVAEAGLNIVGTDISALAALRAMAVAPRPEGQLDAIVDIGANITTILLHHNGVPKLLTLDPDSAGQVATAKIADALGLDEEDPEQASRVEWFKVNNNDTVGQVAQARNEYGRSTSAKIASNLSAFLLGTEEFDELTNVTMVGGGAMLHGLGNTLYDTLADRLGQPVELTYADLDPSISGPGGAPVDRIENQSGGDYLVAIGLGTANRI